MNLDCFRSLVRQKEHNFIMIQILPSLCLSPEFLEKYKRKQWVDPKSRKILKVIFEQLKSDDEERIIIGIKCLEALNSKYRTFLHSEVKNILKYVSLLVRAENEKVKEKSMDFLVSILSNWTGKERESLGE